MNLPSRYVVNGHRHNRRGGSIILPLCLLLLVVLLPVGGLRAQRNNTSAAHQVKRYSYGIDPQRDTVAFKKMQQRMNQIRKQRPTVALVLSGGGAKGAAEISVIRYLDQIGIPIDLVVGTSIGGLLGGLYACGYSGADMERLIRELDWDYLIRDTYPRRYNTLDQKDYDKQYQINVPFGRHQFSKSNDVINTNDVINAGLSLDGIVHGRNISNLFSSLLIGYENECDFLSLPTPFICIATDMVTAQPKVWHCGRLTEALRSTMSIPGLFTPVRTNGMVLMDGSMRSNYPAELARHLGADYIIGVDISAPARDATGLNNFFDYVFQTTDVLGRETYLAGLAATDLYIKPDVDDFSIISFDSASINTLIERGNDAVKKHQATIDSLRSKIGYVAPRAPFRKAVNLIDRPIIISEVRYNGVSENELPKLKHLFRPGQMVTKRQLDNTVAMLMGTQAFSSVTYELLGKTSPYVLQFNCRRARSNRLGASARFDNLDFASLLLHIGLNSQALEGSRWDFTARIGMKTLLMADYSYNMHKGWDVGGTLSLQSIYNGRFRAEPYDFLMSFMRGRADMYLSWQPSNKMRLKMGARMDYFRHFSLMRDYNITSTSNIAINPSDFYPSAFATLRSDTYDDPYFPSHGTQYYLSARYYLAGLLHGTDNFYAFHGSFSTVWSDNKMAFCPFAEGRYVSQLVMPYVNMLSVSTSNNILDQQIPFMGLSYPELGTNMLTTAGLRVRYNPAGHHFFTATIQLLHESQKIEDFFDGQQAQTFFGTGVEYAYQTLIGPLRADMHWNSITKGLGFRISMGLDF